MRIVGGTLSGRRFRGPPAEGTRPTSERVREALASALDARDRLRGARVLDLYAGTGALAFEALSRGATSAVLVEREPKVARILRESAAELGLTARVRVEVLDLHGALEPTLARIARQADPPFDLIFADPPYVDVDRVPPLFRGLITTGLVAADALFVLEHARKTPPQELRSLAPVAAYEYGDTAVALLEADVPSNDEAP